MNDTIYALATAPGRAAAAVIRLSGPRSGEVLDAIAGSRPAPRRASLRTLRDIAGDRLDDAVVLWFEGPASFTGEDSAELHVHGGPAVIEAVTRALATQGARPAEAGEFTRRAFANGKLDLTQAEAVADLVDAQTEAQRRQALAQLEGALGRRYLDWRERLIEALALLEAEVDFPDEEVPGGVGARSRPVLEALRSELQEALCTSDRGRRVREGYRIALIGPPNAGKSSLLNALAGREAAIVTPRPGTTRDVVEVPLLLNGYAALLADTAGLRDASDEIEAEGVRRARAWAMEAALRLLVIDASAPPPAELSGFGAGPGDWVLLSKSDLPAHPGAGEVRAWAERAGLEVRTVSTMRPEGVEEARAALAGRVADELSGADPPAVTRARHRALLEHAEGHLGRALAASEPELTAEDVRLAARALEQVVGAVGAEDVLGKVFASFCIGK